MNKEQEQSQLIAVLREGVSVIQMILFKEIRTSLAETLTDFEPATISMVAGAIVNDIFGTPNPEEKFVRFYEQHKELIEKQLRSLAGAHNELVAPLTDALRIQALCDNQEGGDSTALLQKAQELGYLLADRNVPMPSSFMTLVRGLGEKHNLIIAPVQITPEQDKQIVH